MTQKKRDKNATEYIDPTGYRWIRPPEGYNGPKMTHRNWAREHHVVLFLNGIEPPRKPFECHHINEDRLDNRIENLQVLTTAEHKKIHMKLKPLTKPINHGISGYTGNYQCRCEVCKEGHRTYTREWARKNRNVSGKHRLPY